MRKILYNTIIIILLCSVAYAAEVQDGFYPVRTIESGYFTIYVENGVDLKALALRIAVPPSIKAIIRTGEPFADSLTVQSQLDTLFLAVCETMDMPLKNFKCKVKICRNSESLGNTAVLLFGKDIKVPAFYLPEINTLYIDAENADINIVGHELSHAVQVNYFIVPPPEKIQEVLAGYVEYQFRKYTNTLPQRK